MNDDRPRWAEEVFSMFPKDWGRTTVGAIADLTSGATPPRSQLERYFLGGAVPWVKTGDLTDRDITCTDENIAEAAVRECRCTIHPPGTLLISMYGGFQQIGRTGILRIAAATNQAITAIHLKPDCGVTAEFLQAWLFLKRRVWRRLAGSSRKDPNISKSSIAAFPVPIVDPHLLARLDIAMASFDRVTTGLSRLTSAKRNFKKGLSQQLLAGQRRFPAFVGESKKRVALKEFLTLALRPVAKPSQAYRCLGIRSHGRGTFEHDAKDPATVAMKTLYEVKTNDLILNITFAWEGAVAIVKKRDEGALVSHRFPTFSVDTTKACVRYLAHLIRTKQFVHALGLVSPGGAGRNRVLNKDDFLSINVWLPSLVEQNAIANLLDLCEHEIDLLAALREKIELQKRSLVSRLLSGELKVPV